MYKKVLAIVLSVLILNIFGSTMTYGEEKLSLKLDSVKAEKGSTVSLKAMLTNVTKNGIDSGNFVVEYDSSKFTYKDITAGDIVFDKKKDLSVNKDIKDAIVVMYSDYNLNGKSCVTKDGVLCMLSFEVLKDCPDGSYDIKLKKASELSQTFSEISFRSQLVNALDVEFTPGSINIGNVPVKSENNPTKAAVAAHTEVYKATGVESKKTYVNPKSIILKTDDENAVIDGESVQMPEIKPIEVENMMYLPVKKFVELYGGNEEWKPTESMSVINIQDKCIKIYSSYYGIYINDEEKPMDEAPIIVNDLIYMPLSYMSVTFSCIVEWDTENHMIKVSK